MIDMRPGSCPSLHRTVCITIVICAVSCLDATVQSDGHIHGVGWVGERPGGPGPPANS